MKLSAFTIALLLLLSMFNACASKSETIDTSSAPYAVLKAGPLALAVDTLVGGRIASFTYEGKEILKTSRDSNNWQWGSTLWLSPQSVWNWPPTLAFDQGPYTVDRFPKDSSLLVFTSEVDPATQLQVTKHLRLAIDEQRGPLASMRYKIYNRGAQAQWVGIWENTRVPWLGHSLLPSGGQLRLADSSRAINFSQPDTAHWRLAFDEKQPNAQKIFYDPLPPQGPRPAYLIHNYYCDGLVLEKSWAYPSAVAPGQSRVEIYLAPQEGFAELEIQGEYRMLAPGESVSLLVFWRLFPAP